MKSYLYYTGLLLIFKSTVFSAILTMLILLTSHISFANNLVLGSPSISVSGSSISFTIQWDNSWDVSTGPQNWDAVWVFVKRQSCTDNEYKHALVSASSSNHAIGGSVLKIDAAADGMGVFIRRIANGTGNISQVTATLNLQVAPNLQDNFQVFGIEMVYIPKGSFSIGDLDPAGANTDFGGPNNTTVLIDSTTQANGIGAEINYSPTSSGSSAPLTSSFPLGYNSYYSMKYEISQEQYAAFLNTLTFIQQNSRTAGSPFNSVGTRALITSGAFYRNEIKIVTPAVSNAIYNTPNTPAVYGSVLPNVACNFLSWRDLLAYLDWAALRPMTEFEYEKSCRGPVTPVPAEKAWGTADITTTSIASLSNAGTANETSTISGLGLCSAGNTGTTNGPLRCGFAATASTTRITSGASYYGIMDMAGNVAEMCVGGDGNFSAFTSNNGDGTIDGSGFSDVIGWPPSISIRRGGNFRETNFTRMTISNRTYWSSSNSARELTNGGRGVRNW